ncbi:hypothetical protein ANCDUO_07982 [Ancylostoma duodenale]|uniref:Uncharacterized protein n=1 Tax=Ancylostoma duodenale TaxID=51022 RepID=A0A0C2GKI3_9BILA|nr:hypothetical protein ANCDUO_07982 [Ancylostoma duodenale]
MLAPIITKDMKLFPTRPLPAGIKNVRSRAQSLDQFSQVQNSGSARGRIVPVKPRSSQSTGNLPSVAASASFSRSPPKASVHRKTTLTAIQEGVEMGHNHVPDSRHMESRSDSKLPSNVPRRNSKRTKKNDKENEATKNGHCENIDATSTASDSAVDRKEKKSVVRWLTSAFRKSKDKDLSDNSSSNSS